MDSSTFDRLTRAVAVRLTRRGVLGGMAGAAALGMSGASGVRLVAAQDDLEERSVEIYEAMAGLAHSHAGSCADLAAKIRSFTDEHQDELGRIAVEQSGWDADRKRAHVDTYGDRRQAATMAIESASFRCRSAADPEPFPGLTGSGGNGDGTPVATPVAALGATGHAKAALPARLQSCPDTKLMCTVVNSNANPPVGTQVGKITVGQCGFDCDPCDQGHDHYAGTCGASYGACSNEQPYPNTQLYCRGDKISDDTCDCSSVCASVTTGDCISYGAGTLVGSDCSACWVSMCVSRSWCETNCNSNQCCNTACSEAPVPPPPGP